MRPGLILATLSLIAGCGCSDVADIVVLDDGGATQGAVQVVTATLADFVAWTGREQLCVDRIELVRDVAPSASSDPTSDPIGRYDRTRDSIVVERDLSSVHLESATRHELCHALDRTEDLVDPEPELWLPFGADPDSGLPARLQDNEVYADTCELGPSPALERHLREVCGADATEIGAFLEDIVYPEAPPLAQAPGAVDVTTGETLRWEAPGGLDGVAAVKGGLAVLTDEGGPVVRFLSWDLVERSQVWVDAPGAWVVAGGRDDVVLVDWWGQRDSVRVGADGEVMASPARLEGAWSAAVWGDTLVGLSGGEGEPVEIVSADLTTGEPAEAGLPVMYGPSSIQWTASGLRIPASAGVWSGTPGGGWRYDLSPHASAELTLEDGRWLGSLEAEAAGGDLETWVVVAPDGALSLPLDPCAPVSSERLVRDGDAVHSLSIFGRSGAIEVTPVSVGPELTP